LEENGGYLCHMGQVHDKNRPQIKKIQINNKDSYFSNDTFLNEKNLVFVIEDSNWGRENQRMVS
jgi:hypothetical protein